jgi:hypothetical protein
VVSFSSDAEAPATGTMPIDAADFIEALKVSSWVPLAFTVL